MLSIRTLRVKLVREGYFERGGLLSYLCSKLCRSFVDAVAAADEENCDHTNNTKSGKPSRDGFAALGVDGKQRMNSFHFEQCVQAQN